MRHSDFKTGEQFHCGGGVWVVTDIGARVIVAIPFIGGWMAGPPYAQQEQVFDENDMPGCEP